MHLIAMLIGYFLGGTLLSSIILTIFGTRPGYYRPNYIFLFICGCLGAGIAQAIAVNLEKRKKQKQAEKEFSDENKPSEDEKDYSDYFYD